MKTEQSISFLAVALVLASVILGAFIYAVGPANTNVELPSTINLEGEPAVPGNTQVVVEQSQDPRTISVTANHTIFVSPTQANVWLSVTTLESSAQKAQEANAKIMEKVIAALVDAGVAKEDIKTESFSLFEKTEWNYETNKSVSVGFEAVHALKVKVLDTDELGKIIDKAVGAGANRVSNIEFTISDERMEELQNDALKEAALKAKGKAELIAQTLGLELDGVQSANEANYSYRPYRFDFSRTAMSESAQTTIMEGQVQVNASISLAYLIK